MKNSTKTTNTPEVKSLVAETPAEVKEVKNEKLPEVGPINHLEVKPEDKKEIKEEIKNEKPELKNETKPELKNGASESEKSITIINKLIDSNKSLKIVAADSKTGTSYFSGKKRLCKLIKTKRGVTLEINVVLPKEMKELSGMETISISTAHKKHLGTMKHLYRSEDSKQITNIMKAILEVFKQELEAAKKLEEANKKPETKAV